MKPVPNAGVLPKAGVEDAPNAGVEVPSGEGWVAPNTPVAVPPKREFPDGAPKVGLPKGFAPNSELLWVAPKGLDGVGEANGFAEVDIPPKGLGVETPKAGNEINFNKWKLKNITASVDAYHIMIEILITKE